MMGRFQVLLVNLGRQTTTVRNISPPVGLLFLAALARTDRRVSVRVIDQRAENCPLDSIVDRARSPQPDLVGLRCLTPDAHLLKQAVDAFRAAVPQARILVGGPHASALGARILEDVAADAAVIGEGERSFQLIIEAAIAGTSTFESVPGLVWRDAAGDIVSNPGLPPVVEDLDSLPFPAYDLVDVSLYWRTHNMSMIPRRKYLALFTSRGCPFQCNYCHDIFGKKFRAHSAERIADEMQHYDKTFGVSDFDILDDVFNLDPLRVIELSDLMRRRGMKTKLSFPNGLRTDILSADIVDALAAMGTNYAALALETGSPRLQEKIGKRLNIPKYLEGVKM
ncbi:MAG: radical SAM protein, partial [Candidatus Hydrogenedentes bacterium]|nr:radical SAM protein [Candidatus Hydrogenedentota bacterium]